ncbi:hypothetical protein mRhiFer1_009425 [Rhinolophus ferrumequinum]|uniref:Uncharacterized protein n=1 Tax=Rhinolophus ferrumequinum TaxID=59479 RepID=A0A7J7RIV1_RHIFE|nr:hypothetical protein mRhiFer1_009425 [Rhinolophus ferrumequinum]
MPSPATSSRLRSHKPGPHAYCSPHGASPAGCRSPLLLYIPSSSVQKGDGQGPFHGSGLWENLGTKKRKDLLWWRCWEKRGWGRCSPARRCGTPRSRCFGSSVVLNPAGGARTHRPVGPQGTGTGQFPKQQTAFLKALPLTTIPSLPKSIVKYGF